MREIKFRAWDKVENRMIGWDDKAFPKSRNDVRLCECPLKNMNKGYLVYMQFTGLKDKNGKEIYEGDIIRFLPFAGSKHFLPMPVFWDDNYCGFKTKLRAEDSDDIITCFGDLDGCVNSAEIEVIGNIYENPELLK